GEVAAVLDPVADHLDLSEVHGRRRESLKDWPKDTRDVQRIGTAQPRDRPDINLHGRSRLGPSSRPASVGAGPRLEVDVTGCLSLWAWCPWGRGKSILVAWLGPVRPDRQAIEAPALLCVPEHGDGEV